MADLTEFLNELIEPTKSADTHSLVKRIDFAERVKEFSIRHFDTDLSNTQWRVATLKPSNANMDGIIAYPDTNGVLSMRDATGALTIDNLNPIIAGALASMLYSIYAHESDIFSGSAQVSLMLYRNWRDLRHRMISLLDAAIDCDPILNYSEDKGIVISHSFKDLSESAKQSFLDVQHQFNSIVESEININSSL